MSVLFFEGRGGLVGIFAGIGESKSWG
uniref:Uncharacterized protein n=1 Tax=Rhizophora mucronata TaxID=61149 RepID=A0A2P2PWK5_RHIMU